MRSTPLARRTLAALTLAALAAAPARVAEACHTYDHAKHLQGIGIGVPADVMSRLAAIPIDFEPIPAARLGATKCVDGMADIYPCQNVDLLAFLPLASMGGGSGNDIWGWTDPVTGVEWALVGRTNGTAFVSLADPTNPVYVANLPTQTSNSSWRDIKVYADHAFIVSEAGGHGIQVFDLNTLRTIVNPPVTLSTATDLAAHYAGVGNSHNLAINEATGFAYAVGTSTCGGGGLHMVNIGNPAAPTFAGCVAGDGYTHDTQCVLYQGPDVEHQGAEICFSSNEDTLTIDDVTNKSAPVQLSRTGYATSAYTHQGWLTPDQRYFVLDDELDENPEVRRTYVWDLVNLDQPVLLGAYEATGARAASRDHNQYVAGDLVYQSNYAAGLSVLQLGDPVTANLTDFGYFDTRPENNGTSFTGTWSNYPFFASGAVIVNDINRGLFVVEVVPPEVPLIFEDGFESGDVSAWSTSVED